MTTERRTMVGSSFWDEPEIRKLTSRQLCLYFLLRTHEGLSHCAVLAATPYSLASWISDFTEATVIEDMAALHKLGLVFFDAKFGETFVRTHVRHNGGLKHPFVLGGMVRDFRKIASDRIQIAFLQELHRLYSTPDLLSPVEKHGILCLVGVDKPEKSRALAALRENLGQHVVNGQSKNLVGSFSILPDWATVHNPPRRRPRAKPPLTRENTDEGEGGVWITPDYSIDYSIDYSNRESAIEVLRTSITSKFHPSIAMDAAAMDGPDQDQEQPVAEVGVGPLAELAARVASWRPDWDEPGIRAVLRKAVKTREIAQVAASMEMVAKDPKSRTPARLLEPGPWWHIRPPAPPWPAWCGKCDEQTRQIETDSGMAKCVACHPISPNTAVHSALA